MTEASKAKGTAVLGAVRMLRSSKERARTVLPEHLHHYLQDRIYLVSWYPEQDLLDLVRACLELLDMPRDEGLATMGRWLAAEHFRSVYGRFKNTPDPRGVAIRLSSLWSAQHNTGRHTFIVESSTRGRIELSDFAHPAYETCSIVGEYSREFLTLAGWGAVTVRKLRCVLSGDERCTWQHTWTTGPSRSMVPEAGTDE